MGRTQNATAALDTIGQDLPRPGVVLDGDQDAAEVGQGADDRDAVPAEHPGLGVEERLERVPGGQVVGHGPFRQAQVVQGAHGRRVIDAQGVPAAGDDSLVQGPGVLGPAQVGQRDGEPVGSRESVEVARPEDALAALQEDGVLVARRREVVHLEADRRLLGLRLERGRMLGAKELAPGIHHLAADGTAEPQVVQPLQEDIQVLERGQAGDGRQFGEVGT